MQYPKFIAQALILCALQASLAAADECEQYKEDREKQRACECMRLFPKPEDFKKCIDNGDPGPILNVPDLPRAPPPPSPAVPPGPADPVIR